MEAEEDRSVLTRPAPPPPLTLCYGEASGQVADAWTGGGRAVGRPLLLLLHGGFWRPEYDRAHLRPMGAALSDAGWTVASVEYRREPGCPGITLGDVRAAAGGIPAELSGRGVPFDGSVVLVGHSAGGHLALWAAAGAAVGGLAGTLALAPVADLLLAHERGLGGGAVADFLGGPPPEDGGPDPVRLPAPDSPVVIVHGTRDVRVPFAVAESYAAAHPAARLVPVPGAGHFELIDPLSRAWPRVTGALAELAAASRGSAAGSPPGRVS